ncbi:TPA: VENN motif pre-toxin domain-containing protein, partial [Escherichia coli]|nr:VENN motif pre-toxin domain-containing protein [Escherichia coli]
LHNEADYKVSHSGISLSGGGSFGDKFQGNMPGGMISAGGHSGHAEGTTQAAVAEGTITIRDRDNQKQNLANLSRDPAHANDSISPIFDKEKEQRRLQTVWLISDIGSQVADIARTQGELNALKAAKEATGETLPANATEKQRQEYLAKLRDTQAYRNEMAKYGTGSEIQRGIQVAMAALQGLAGGNMAGALAGASAPELANIIGHHAGIDDNTAAKAIAHAILGGVTAALQGNSAAAGAIGAGTGEVIASAIAKSLYPDVDPSKLTEEQKQTVSTLATLSAGMAGGIASGDVAGAAAGAGAGKNVVENNMLNVIATETAANTAAAIAGATGNASKDTGNDNGWDIGGGCEGSREQCAVRDPSRDGSRGPGHVLNGDNTDENKQPNLGKDVASATDKEKAELGGAGAGTPGGWGPDNEEKARHQEVQQQRFDELSKIYDKSHPVGELTVDGQTIRQSSVSNRYGTTKVFESQNLTDKQIHNYAQQLAGDTPLKEVRPGIYTAKLDNGTSITLRNLSSSQEQTGARWTIDIKGNKQLSDIAYKYKDVEIKFK